MFVGHFAIGFAAKRAAPKVSLGTLILAAAFSDAVWIVFFASGIEQVVIQPGIMVANRFAGRHQYDLLRARRSLGLLDEPQPRAPKLRAKKNLEHR
jgi:hypothetical protein